MILRILNLVVIVALVAAAAYVYRIKFDSTVQAERLAKIRSEVRRERDTIAALRAEWGELDNPARIEALAKRFLQLKPVTPTQFNSLDQLARPSAAIHQARQPGSDRRHDREFGGARHGDGKHRRAGLRSRRTRQRNGRASARKSGSLNDDRDHPNRNAAARANSLAATA